MKKLNTLLLLLAAAIASAQIISGTVKSREDQRAVPFAKIGIENEKAGVISDENGRFSFDLTDVPRDKTVKVEVGGYEALKMAVSDFIKQNPRDILLKEKVRNIAEVVIKPKSLVDKNWGVNIKNNSLGIGSDADTDYKDGALEIALLFRNRKRAKLERININITELKASKPVFVRFMVYDKNLNAISLEDLNAYITSENVKNGTFSFDCSKYNIWLRDDFYVSMQLVNFSKGKFYMNGSLFGNKNVYRENMDAWQKVPLVTPALNIDVKVEK